MITKNDLLEWLKKIDNKLRRDIILIAIGGTAMTLLNLKPSTIDVDFCVEKKDYDVFKEAINEEKKFRVDVFVDGFIFSEQLPDDYVNFSKEYDIFLKNIKLKILHPIDIIITKAARYNARDEEDIALLVKTKEINKKELIKRFDKVVESYAGSEDSFRSNFEFILKRHFKE